MDPQLVQFYRQYMQQIQTLTIPSGNLLVLPYVQDQLYKHFFNGPLKGPAAYQRKVLKQVISLIERNISDPEQDAIHDALAEHMAYLSTQPQAPPEQAASETQVVTYTLPVPFDEPDPPFILIEEAPNLLAAGSNVGLRTWEASLRLATYLCDNPSLLRSRNVIELGAGTGLLSILCAAYLGTSSVLATDGLPHVVEMIDKNVTRNAVNKIFSRHEVQPPRAAILEWGDLTALDDVLVDADDNALDFDLILGADITYSPDIVPLLARLLSELLHRTQDSQALISATVRNEQTLMKFREACTENKLHIEEIRFSCGGMKNQRGFFHEQAFPTVIMRIVLA